MRQFSRRQFVGSALGLAGALGGIELFAGPRPNFEGGAQARAWPASRADTWNSGYNPSVRVPRSQPARRWTRDGPSVEALVVAADRVYAGGRDGIVAYDTGSGREKWQRDVDASSLCVHDGRLYAAAHAGPVRAFDGETGSVAWADKSPSPHGEFVLRGGNALYVGYDAHVEARDPATGETWWQWETPGRGWVTAAVTDDRLYVYAPGLVFALGEQTGFSALAGGPTRVWRSAAATSRYPPTVTDDTVYVGSRDPLNPTQRLFAYDRRDGALRWKSAELGEHVSPPAVDGDRASVGVGSLRGDAEEGAVVAFDTESLQREWTVQLPRIVGPPVTDGRTVVAGAYQGAETPVYALDAATGDRLWTVRVPGSAARLLALVDDTVYVGTGDGRVVAFSA